LVRFITMALETLNKELETLQGLEQELDQELTQAIELKQALELELELERDRELEAKANTTATTSFDDAEMGETPTQLQNICPLPTATAVNPQPRNDETDNTETHDGTIEK
jgi:hypothetical protein